MSDTKSQNERDAVTPEEDMALGKALASDDLTGSPAHLMEARELGVSPSKANYLRKLKKGVSHGKSRSQLSVAQSPQSALLPGADGPVNLVIGGTAGAMGAGHLQLPATDQRFNNSGTNFSPSKQSVLVKRVLRDGRVVSGLDRHGSHSPQRVNSAGVLDDDQGTLGSNGGYTNARESNIVNYATVEGSDSRMRSTMYVTGK